jgi:hypothetical protein
MPESVEVTLCHSALAVCGKQSAKQKNPAAMPILKLLKN